MRVAPCVFLAALCLTGCSTFGKKHAKAPDGPDRADRPDAAASRQRGNDLPLSDATAPPPGMNGFLAGVVIDGNYHRPPITFIQVVESPELGNRGGAPIEVPADGQGNFKIQGLQPGKKYQLIARARDGSQYLAGSVYATPPDPKVLIRVSASYPAPDAPSQPGATWPAPAAPTPPPPDPPAPSWPQGPAPGKAADLGPPVPGFPPPPQAVAPVAPPPVPVRPDSIAGNNAFVKNDLPAEMRGPGALGSTQALQGPARVPSCVLTGNKLENFALSDLTGQPWEFRRHPSQLTLIDFWGTWCPHCIHAIPHLNILQSQYGRFGLQVVGIAYESGAFRDQVVKVNRMRQVQPMNYQVLLGSDQAQCPVKKQFQVYNFPKFVLLDQGGKIVWQGEGADRETLREMEIVIKQQLRVR